MIPCLGFVCSLVSFAIVVVHTHTHTHTHTRTDGVWEGAAAVAVDDPVPYVAWTDMDEMDAAAAAAAAATEG